RGYVQQPVQQPAHNASTPLHPSTAARAMSSGRDRRCGIFSLRVCSRTLAIPAAFSTRSQPEACRYVPMDASTLVALPHLFGIPNRYLLAWVWVLCAGIAAGIADVKDRSVLGVLGFLVLGLLTGPLAIVAAVRRP